MYVLLNRIAVKTDEQQFVLILPYYWSSFHDLSRAPLPWFELGLQKGAQKGSRIQYFTKFSRSTFVQIFCAQSFTNFFATGGFITVPRLEFYRPVSLRIVSRHFSIFQAQYSFQPAILFVSSIFEPAIFLTVSSKYTIYVSTRTLLTILWTFSFDLLFIFWFSASSPLKLCLNKPWQRSLCKNCVWNYRVVYFCKPSSLPVVPPSSYSSTTVVFRDLSISLVNSLPSTSKFYLFLPNLSVSLYFITDVSLSLSKFYYFVQLYLFPKISNIIRRPVYLENNYLPTTNFYWFKIE